MAGSEEYRQENVLSQTLTHLKRPPRNTEYDFLICNDVSAPIGGC